VQLAQPRALAVAVHPLLDRLPRVVQLDAAVVAPGPHVDQAVAELGVPHQWRQVVDHDTHPDVVDRTVGERADSLMKNIWKVLGLAGLAGVAATGVIIARDERRRAQVTPDEVRARLHRRLEEIGEPDLAAQAQPGDLPVSSSRSRSAFKRCCHSSLRMISRQRRAPRPEPSDGQTAADGRDPAASR
jgi:hypothetical protein